MKNQIHLTKELQAYQYFLLLFLIFILAYFAN